MFSLSLLMMSGLQAQEDKSKRPSPPASSEATIGGTKIKVDYSAPSAKGRTIFGELEAYGAVWRTGANEATIFETSADISVEGQALPAGRYALFTIPNKDSWTIIFNTESDQWGAYRYKDSKDALRVNVTPNNDASMNEKLIISVEDKGGNKGAVTIAWDKTSVTFNISTK